MIIPLYQDHKVQARWCDTRSAYSNSKSREDSKLSQVFKVTPRSNFEGIQRCQSFGASPERIWRTSWRARARSYKLVEFRILTRRLLNETPFRFFQMNYPKSDNGRSVYKPGWFRTMIVLILVLINVHRSWTSSFSPQAEENLHLYTACPFNPLCFCSAGGECSDHDVVLYRK